MATKAVVGAVALLVSMSATPAFAGKQEARDVGQGLSVIAAAGVVTPEPTTSAARRGPYSKVLGFGRASETDQRFLAASAFEP